MHIDIPTLQIVTTVIALVAGCMLLFSWFQNRKVSSLVYWGAAFLVGTLGAILMLARPVIPSFLSIDIANALVLSAYGLAWSGVRMFAGRAVRIKLALAGAAIWLVVCRIPWFHDDFELRVFALSLFSAGYLLAAAAEVLCCDKELTSRRPTAAFLVAQAAFFLARVPLVDSLPFPLGRGGDLPPWAWIFAFFLMINHFCLAFLAVSMAKERLALEHRRMASLDPLTGIANRRAFLERGDRVLRRAFHQRMPVALLLLDLDFFKQINDTFGHQAGDCVLRDFCAGAGDMLRPGDLFGRLGGEEFACLLPGADLSEAMRVAERIRAGFSAYTLPEGSGDFRFSVSIGVAEAADAQYALGIMFANADRALYQAKAKGRNRIERARGAPSGLVGGTDVATAAA